MKRFRLLVVLGILLITPEATMACFCGAAETPPESGMQLLRPKAQAGAIFTARASEVSSEIVVFEIETLFKGDIKNRLILKRQRSSCDLHFKLEQSYLIYARQYTDILSGESIWTTSICDRSKRLIDADVEIRMLWALKLKLN